MVEIAPFRGVLYNLERVGDPSLVIAPPYDVISPEEQEALYSKSPYNIVRLILTKGEEGKDRYSIAGDTLRRWLREGVLIRDARPAIYPYFQTYRVDGLERTRKGFIALLRLEEFDSGKVFPHERTLSKPKEDRLRLMEACRANLCPVFGLYSDPAMGVEAIFEGLAERRPLIEVTDREGVRNRFWRLDEEEKIEEIGRVLMDKFVLIADGHHRYETALTYREMMRKRHGTLRGDEPFNYVMMYLSNMEDEGFTILPTHRLLYGVPEERVRTFMERAKDLFTVEEYTFDGPTEGRAREAFYKRLEEMGMKGAAIGVSTARRRAYSILIPKDTAIAPLLETIPHEMRHLDLTILHEVAIKGILGLDEEALATQRHIEYIKDRGRALDLVREGRYQMAFILNSPKIRDIIAVVKAGMRMPQKSTYFYPKLLSGLVIHSFNGE